MILQLEHIMHFYNRQIFHSGKKKFNTGIMDFQFQKSENINFKQTRGKYYEKMKEFLLTLIALNNVRL